jgi:hypothetical protein
LEIKVQPVLLVQLANKVSKAQLEQMVKLDSRDLLGQLVH